MTLDEYSTKVGETAVYNGTPLERLNYASVAMGGEVGEYLNEYKKYLRLNPYSHQLPDMATCHRMVLELGDTLWYLTRTANELGSSLEEVARMNIDKLATRYGK